MFILSSHVQPKAPGGNLSKAAFLLFSVKVKNKTSVDYKVVNMKHKQSLFRVS